MASRRLSAAKKTVSATHSARSQCSASARANTDDEQDGHRRVHERLAAIRLVDAPQERQHQEIDITSTGRYTIQWRSAARPLSRSANGTCVNNAISTACKANVP